MLDTQPIRSCPACRAIYRTDFERCPSDGTPLRVDGTDPLVGSVVAKHYQIDALLGEGGMARVYRAHHTLLRQRQVAIKVLLGDLASTIAMRLRFGQEAELASRLDHPHVVSVIDYGSDDRLLFLVMELVAGRTLGDLIAAEAPLPPRRAIALARQLCQGLAHAHDRGLVHRDFKPDNVIVSADDHAVITDFGIAISRDDDGPASRLTTAGIALGTPSYAAPEQTHRGTVDHRADLFALGVTLYEMLSGRLPFDGNAMEVVVRNASEAPPSIAQRSGVQIPSRLEAVVLRLMSRRPQDRFASALETLEALEALEALEEVSTPTAAVTQPAAVPLARRRRWWSAAALSTVVVAGAVTWQASRGAESIERASPVRLLEVPVATTEVPPARVASVTSEPPAPEPPAPEPLAPEKVLLPRTKARPRDKHPPPVVAMAPSVVEEVPSPTPSTPSVGLAVPVIEPAELPAPPAPVMARPLVVHARARFVALRVRGALSDGVIARALERTTPGLRACFTTTATASSRSTASIVHVTFSIDETRQPISLNVTSSWRELGRCVEEVLGALRTEIAPDVGVVPVSVDVSFQPENT